MLTEKEINHIIDSHVGVTESMTRDLHNAAAAIAKRLSEGVVWSGEGSAATVAVHDGELTIVALGKAAGLLKLVNCTSMREFNGQLVSVTVKIVEGTKDDRTS